MAHFRRTARLADFFAATPGGGFTGGPHGEIEYFTFGAGGLASLLHQPGVDFLEETWNGGEDGGVNFNKSLSDVFDCFNVGNRAAVKNINVIEHAAVDMG